MLAIITLTALNLLDIIKPKPLPRAEAYISDRLPTLELFELEEKPPVRKPRKKHICTWTDQEVWGAVIAVFIIGLFIGHCL